MDGDIAKDFFIRTTDVVFSNAKTRKFEYLSLHAPTCCLLNQFSCNPHFTSKYMILTAIYTGAF
ncbi:hypothetical protein ACW18Z_00355 [Limosilactobacillus fermentum]